ncbi:MAG: thrombospondin type 3 repeat-containing protein [Myxococcota bacterium]|nr:thrombospondin type 3 repeat-containing protein [Myxococcota bacterium]
MSDWDELGLGTDPNNPDSDGDGTSDLVEVVAGTDPLDAKDNPVAHGNFVFLVPWEQNPLPEDGELRFKTSVSQVDLYFLEDISVSMDQELQAIHDNMVKVLDELTCDKGESAASCAADCPATCGNDSCDSNESMANCPEDCLGLCGDGACLGNESPTTCPGDCSDALCGPVACCGDGHCDDQESPLICPSDCPGTCGDHVCHAGEQAAITGCIADLWSGAGAFGTASSKAPCTAGSGCDKTKTGAFPYKNLVNIQAAPATTQAAVPSDCWGNGCWEPGLSALFFMATGYGTASAVANGYVVPPLAVPEPAACPAGYRGYPCFRPVSLPIILLIGDEPFSQCYLPDAATLGNCVDKPSKEMATRDFPIVSEALASLGARVVGVKGSGSLSTLTLDMEHLGVQSGSVDNDGEPFVFAGADDGAADAITEGIKNLTTSIPFDMMAIAKDNAGDSVDAVAAFVNYLEVYGPGTAECMNWPTHDDPNADGHDEQFLGVKAGLPVCWKLVPKQNTTVPATGAVQVYTAQVQLLGDGMTVLDTRTVYFVVPPVIGGPT